MKIHKLLIAILIFLAILLIASFVPGFQKATSQEPNNVVNLVRPAFLQTAHAQEGTEGFDIGQMLEDEAGISAYFQTSGAIDLDLVRDLFSTIELETTDYIVGSIPVPNYPGVFDNHVYVHTDGWIMAYYFNTDPVAKAIDVKATTIDTTLLKSTVATVAGAAGMPFTDVTYYDFRYPNATNMMFIGESDDEGDYNFMINLPSGYGYSERSWSVVNIYDGNGNYWFRVDGNDMEPSAEYWGNDLGYGFITFSELLPDIDHNIEVIDYGALVIVYTVP